MKYVSISFIGMTLFIMSVYLGFKGILDQAAGSRMFVVGLMLIGSGWVYGANRSNDVSF